MVICKRKQEIKKTKKHAFDQESGQEKKIKKHALHHESVQEKKKNDNGQENTLSTKKATKKFKKKNFLFFLVVFLVCF